MRFPPSFLDDIRNRVSVSSVIGRKVAWDRRKSNPGKGDYWACCPFHNEKTPSFHVDDKKGRYYCFGCKVSGDVFTYLVEKEGVPFPDAVAQLASGAGLPMPGLSGLEHVGVLLGVVDLEVPRRVRQNILDGLRIEKVNWNGQLDETEFLARIFDLKALPSTDSRFEDAAGDIWQHRINNSNDWPDDWIYSDNRFELLSGPANTFLRFLCEVVHPVVRPDRDEVLKLVGHFNDQLRPEGWVLVEEASIAGRPRFSAKRLGLDSNRAVSRVRAVADALDAGWMQKEIERLERAVEQDPALAIGTAKDLIETCCKSILSSRAVVLTGKEDLPLLTKILAKTLKLVPEGISDEAKGADIIRRILKNLMALTQNLAELRGLYGSGHGRDGKYRGLEVRHARLALGAAATFVDFVTETHKQRGN
jgi:hypothetical protein